MKQDRRPIDIKTILSIPPMVVAGLGLVLALILYLYPPAIQYSSDQYFPAKAVLCPGQRLEATIAYEIRQAPISALLLRLWWSEDKQEVVAVEPPRWTGWMETKLMTDHTLSITVPLLPTGRYRFFEMREQLRDNPSAAYAVPFTIPQDCNQ